MIEDDELRNLYKVSSEEHLQKLEAGILHLEKYPDDESPLEELMREAHSLKGDSRMLEVNNVETLIHQVEHILGKIKRKETTLNSDLSDRLYHGLDALRKLVHEAVTGENSGVDTFHVLAHLMEADKPPQQNLPEETENKISEITEVQEVVEVPEVVEVVEVVEVPEVPEVPEVVEVVEVPEIPKIKAEKPEIPLIKPEITEINLEAPELQKEVGKVDLIKKNITKNIVDTRPTPYPHSEISSAPLNAGEPYRIDTIRVETRYLDALMTQTGELTVTKIRIAHAAVEIEEMANLWEDWRSNSNP
jgi:two-component system chemotaxis sensor kinase CheA